MQEHHHSHPYRMDRQDSIVPPIPPVPPQTVLLEHMAMSWSYVKHGFISWESQQRIQRDIYLEL